MGKLSRTKGAAFERRLAKQFSEVMPGADIRRGLQPQGAHDTGIADVVNPVFWIEAKRGKKPVVRAALEQAVRDCPTGKIPLAVIRDDKEPAFVCIMLDDFLEIVEEWWISRTK